MNTIEWLDHAKSVLSITSDYQLAKKLDISTSRMSHYRNGRYDMDDMLACRLEKLLKRKPGTILLDVHAERTNCPEAARILHDLAHKLAAGALALVLGFTGFLYSSPAPADKLSPSNTVYYVKSRIRRPRPLFLIQKFSFVRVIADFKKKAIFSKEMTKDPTQSIIII